MPQKGSVITWDFDILKGDVTFTVLRCRQHPTAEPHEHHISGAVGGIGSKQYIDKHTVVGVDVSIVEAPTVCRDGDSVQVSDFLNQEVLTHPWKTVRYVAMVSHRSQSRFVAHCWRNALFLSIDDIVNSLTLPIVRLLLSKSQGAKNSENHLNPVMLIFIGKLLLSPI